MKLNVVMLDRHGTQMALMHENSTIPHRRRLVQIDLTEEQVEVLKLKQVGSYNGNPAFEEIGEVWLEEENDPDK